MSNPVFTGGPIGFEVASKVEKGHLVAANAEGKVAHAGAEGGILGAVTEIADPSTVLRPDDVAVHYGTSAVKLVAAGGDASVFKIGDAVFAAANGEVADTGTIQVGVAVRNGENGKVLTVLNGLPVAG